MKKWCWGGGGELKYSNKIMFSFHLLINHLTVKPEQKPMNFLDRENADKSQH